MNAPARINQFDWRTRPCPECNGGGRIVFAARWAGEVYGEPADMRCDECGGSGRIDASCDGCDKLVPLNADNLCGQCVEPLPVELKKTGTGGVALMGAPATPSGSRASTEPVPVSAASGFDPSRIPYRPFSVEAGQVWRSEGYAMFIDHERDARGDPTVETWRFAGEDDGEDGFGWLEVHLHEVVDTARSGVLAVYYRQWFAPDGQPAWGNRPKRTIGAVGSLKALIRRRKMRLQPAIATEARRAETTKIGSVHEGAGLKGIAPKGSA
jgi:hypothetical protein